MSGTPDFKRYLSEGLSEDLSERLEKAFQKDREHNVNILKRYTEPKNHSLTVSYPQSDASEPGNRYEERLADMLADCRNIGVMEPEGGYGGVISIPEDFRLSDQERVEISGRLKANSHIVLVSAGEPGTLPAVIALAGAGSPAVVSHKPVTYDDLLDAFQKLEGLRFTAKDLEGTNSRMWPPVVPIPIEMPKGYGDLHEAKSGSKPNRAERRKKANSKNKKR